MNRDWGELIDRTEDEEIGSDFDIQGDIFTVGDERDKSIVGRYCKVDVFPILALTSVVFRLI